MISRVGRSHVSHDKLFRTVLSRLQVRNLQNDSTKPIVEESEYTESKDNSNEQKTATVEHDSSIPWYLREDVSSQTRTVEVDLPKVPEDAPSTVSGFLELIGKEYGMTDIQLYDLSELPEEHPYSVNNQPFNYIIICSGKSEKHIYKAATELRYWVKQERGYLPPMEGRVSSALNALARRRLLKRAGKGPSAVDNDFGLGKNSWVMCDTKVDGIVIHMLTPDRREHLKLESLWSEEEDIIDDQTNIDNDSIFRGFRRRFHTSSRLSNLNKLQGIYDLLLVQESMKDVDKIKEKFDLNFLGSSISEYNIKYDFYKSFHLLDPTSVTEEELVQTIWDKYSSLHLVCQDWKQEITQDIIKYMGLLIDSPTITSDPTERFDKLSQFISNITLFSEDINLLSNQEFQSLLWRLSYNGSNEVNSATVAYIIKSGKSLEITYTDYLIQNNKRERDVQTFIEDYYTSSGTPIPIWFREQKMLTYGNCGKWSEFWKEWDIIIQTIPSKSALGYWVKLLVFLSERNTIDVLRTFFVEYWNQPQEKGYSFIADYMKNDEQFNSQQEKLAVKNAISKLENECSSFSWFQNAADFASKL